MTGWKTSFSLFLGMAVIQRLFLFFRNHHDHFRFTFFAFFFHEGAGAATGGAGGEGGYCKWTHGVNMVRSVPVLQTLPYGFLAP
jgi:hypothetical protein